MAIIATNIDQIKKHTAAAAANNSVKYSMASNSPILSLETYVFMNAAPPAMRKKKSKK